MPLRHRTTYPAIAVHMHASCALVFVVCVHSPHVYDLHPQTLIHVQGIHMDVSNNHTCQHVRVETGLIQVVSVVAAAPYELTRNAW